MFWGVLWVSVEMYSCLDSFLLLFVMNLALVVNFLYSMMLANIGWFCILLYTWHRAVTAELHSSDHQGVHFFLFSILDEGAPKQSFALCRNLLVKSATSDSMLSGCTILDGIWWALKTFALLLLTLNPAILSHVYLYGDTSIAISSSRWSLPRSECGEMLIIGDILGDERHKSRQDWLPVLLSKYVQGSEH